eukprot:TRINITY_DN756_c0_g1_i1.p1 TRINITY_DN756_c0_g1~~TRINITY_DN756_c0_g1_i1.p1  ORF type:complete len:148 (-),score=30.89 TRINITY_DN756_c0_g1_i1:133-576(-)
MADVKEVNLSSIRYGTPENIKLSTDPVQPSEVSHSNTYFMAFHREAGYGAFCGCCCGGDSMDRYIFYNKVNQRAIYFWGPNHFIQRIEDIWDIFESNDAQLASEDRWKQLTKSILAEGDVEKGIATTLDLWRQSARNVERFLNLLPA